MRYPHLSTRLQPTRAMTQTIHDLQRNLENCSRMPNLIVYGGQEGNEETTEVLDRAVNKNIFEDILELRHIAIEKIHRLGRPSPNKTKSIILKLLDLRQKANILKNAHKLRDTNLSIGQDFSQSVRFIRKKLWDSAKPNRERKEKVLLPFTTLYINKKAYVWDESRNERVLLKKNDMPSDSANAGRPMTRLQAQLTA